MWLGGMLDRPFLLQAEEAGWVYFGHLVDVCLRESFLLEAIEKEYQSVWMERVGGLSHVGGEDAVLRADGADGLGVIGEVELL